MSFWSKVKSAFGFGSKAQPMEKSAGEGASGGFWEGEGRESALAALLGGQSQSWLDQFAKDAPVRVPAHRVAEDASMVRWHLYRRLPNGTREEVLRHQILDWWCKPQPDLLGIDWRYCWFVQMDLEGQNFAWILNPDDLRQGTVLIPPDWLQKFPGPGRPNYEFRMPNGKALELAPSEVVWMKRPDPRRPSGRGLGFGSAMTGDVQQLRWMDQFNHQFFRQGAHVSGVVGIENLSEEGWDRLEHEYRTKYEGVKNAHKLLFTSGKVTGSDIGSRHKDLDFNAGFVQKLRQVRQVIGTPGTVLGDNADTEADAYEAGNIHQTYGLWPRLERLRQNVNTWFLPLFEGASDLELDFENPIRQKAELLAMQYNQALDRGAVRLDEYRRTLGEDPFGAGGERVLWPLNTLPLRPEEFEAMLPFLMQRKGGNNSNMPQENPVTASGEQSQGQTQ